MRVIGGYPLPPPHPPPQETRVTYTNNNVEGLPRFDQHRRATEVRGENIDPFVQ
jgi:hypothetical protein